MQTSVTPTSAIANLPCWIRIYHSRAKVYIPLCLEDELDWYKSVCGCVEREITCPAGSLVLWDSRLVHSPKPVTRDLIAADDDTFRRVAYLCYTPRSWATEQVLQRKREGIVQRVTSSHLAHAAVFNKDFAPRRGQVLSPAPLPVLNPLGRRLAGFEE